MENGSGSFDGSFQDICEDETAMDGRVQVSVHATYFKRE